MIEVTKNHETKNREIKASGTIMELVADTAYIIHEIYDGINDEEMKEFYKHGIILSLIDDRSPVFKTDAEVTDKREEYSEEALEKLTKILRML